MNIGPATLSLSLKYRKATNSGSLQSSMLATNHGRIMQMGLLLLFCQLSGYAQNVLFQYDRSVPLSTKSKGLPNAWAGGLNASQVASVHLNNDPVSDLVVFDRTNDKVTTFLAVARNNGYAYEHAPEYETYFPAMQGWMLLVDYDNDGKKDLFTHTNLGIKVFKNSTQGETIQWQLVADPINTQGFSGQINLQVPVSDIPAITDVDRDGDVDILTYNLSGSNMELHRNQSVENNGNASQLIFKRIGVCWGDFGEGESCGEFTFGVDCGNDDSTPGGRIQHTGSTLLVTDLNGDGQKDVLIGEVECNTISWLNNHGTSLKAHFTEVQPAFPTAKPIDFPTFPALFYEDVDFDGVMDLIATPNVSSNEANQIDFRASHWYYHNQGTNDQPDFVYRQADFLQADMLDLGENATPAFADFDADGDLDLFVGNGGIRHGDDFFGYISLYENVGTTTAPSFRLLNDNYLGLAPTQHSGGRINHDDPSGSTVFLMTNIKPFFADINQDGALDFCFTANEEQETRIKYVLNQAARNQPFRFDTQRTNTYALPLSFNDNPCLYDIDQDGDLDAFVGKSAGNVEYYQNTGTSANPTFQLENQDFAGIMPSSLKRNMVPLLADLDGDRLPELLTGDESGSLTVYAIDLTKLGEPLSGTSELVKDPFTEQPVATKLGGAIYPAVSDLNGDYLPEIITGTNAGGLTYLKNISSPDRIVLPKPYSGAIAYPNPVTRYLYVNVPYKAEFELWSVLGQVVAVGKDIQANKEAALDLGSIANGVYVIRIKGTDGSVVTQRIFIRKE